MRHEGDRGGRTPLPDGEARTVLFQVRLTVEERERLRVAAEAAGIPSTEYLRRHGLPKL